MSDLKFAFRALRRAPLFTVVALLTLALGIGANSAIFSVVNSVLLDPFIVPRLDRLAYVAMRSDQGFDISLSIPNARDLLERSRVFSAAGATRGAGATLTGGERAERMQVQHVYGDLFGALGVAPQLGRALAPRETERGAATLAVLGHAFWERRFAKDPGVVGRTLNLDGRPFTVIGVMPPRFEEISGGTDAYLPMGAFEDLPWEQRGNSPGIVAIGRMRDGVDLAAVSADLDRVVREIRASEEMPASYTVESARSQLLGDAEPALLVLSAAVGLVLLIACANVASLLLARGEARTRELAVRAAIGASRGRLVRQLLTESVLLSVLGGLAGVGVAFAGVKALTATIPSSVPGAAHIAVNAPVVVFTLVLAVATGLVFGLLPALRAARAGSELANGLREGSRGAGDGRDRQRLRGALVVGEVALAVLLLVGAGLTMRSFAALRAVDPGFDPEGVLTARVSPPRAKYPEEERWHALYDQVLERIRAIPGVQSAALGSQVPLGGGSSETQIRPEGAPDDETQSVLQSTTSADYARTMGIDVVRGRWFTEAESRGSLPVAVIDETMAAKFWPGEDPIGKRVTYEQRLKAGVTPPAPGANGNPADFEPIWRTVVGVARNVRHYELQSPSRIQVYRPYHQLPFPITPSLVIYAKTAGDPAALTEAIRREVSALDAELPLFQVRTMEEIVGGRLATGRLIGGLLGFFGTAALVLAAIGIYGVIAYTVARRTREIGVRLALGAQPRDVVRMVAGNGGRLAFAGIALGLLGALGASRLIASLLYGVNPWDPTTFLLVPVLLGGIALLASWIPARRASRTDPAVALGAE